LAALSRVTPYGWPIAGVLAAFGLVYFIRDVQLLQAVPHLAFESPITQQVTFALTHGYRQMGRA
jgi:hypothetical protein